MADILLKFFRFVGINRAISYGVITRFWGIIAGPITMLIIVLRFSREEQGFYYTFSSILAMQVFFELGLMYVISQFASHEFVHLTWETRGNIRGDSHHLNRFTDLLCKSVTWFGVASALLLILLIPVGLIFFSNISNTTIDFSWHIPWVLAVFGTSVNLLTTPFFGVIMGSGDVVTVNHREMIGVILGSCISWTIIGLNGGLFAVFAVTLGNILVSWSYLIKNKPELLKLAWKGIFGSRRRETQRAGISWWGEVWPMQWKIALSWISGYFIFQLFNPVLFHYHGPVVAGQMGMTLSASNALLATCMTWMTTKSPEFGKLIAQRNWKNLDQLFFHTMKQSVALVFMGAFAGYAIIWFLQTNYRNQFQQ